MMKKVDIEERYNYTDILKSIPWGITAAPTTLPSDSRHSSTRIEINTSSTARSEQIDLSSSMIIVFTEKVGNSSSVAQ